MSKISDDPVVSAIVDCVPVTQSVTLIRDTCAELLSLLKRGSVPDHMLTNLQKQAVLRGVMDHYDPAPLFQVHLDCKYHVGPATVTVVPSLPIDGVDLLIANDIGRDIVHVVPVVHSQLETDPQTEILEKIYPGIFPDCVVTGS